MIQNDLLVCCFCNGVINSNPKHGLHVECFTNCFSLSSPVRDFENLALKQVSNAPELGVRKTNTSFFHGMFKKYSAEIEGEQYILKVAQDDCPELPLVELVSNKIGRALDLNIPEFYFIKLGNVQDTFVTKNFMTKKAGANLIHIYHFISDSDSHSCEVILKILNEKCGKLNDIKEFINMCLFDSLIGNHDRHGRNIGIIQSGPSSYALSPIYDNPSYIGIEAEYLLDADLNPKGSIKTSSSNEPTLLDYINEFNNAGHNEIVEDFIKKTNRIWPEILGIVNESKLSEKRKIAFIRILEKRKKEME